MIEKLLKTVDANRDAVLRLTAKMIQIPSPTFHEGELSEFVRQELGKLNMEASVDSIGNVTAHAPGELGQSYFLLNTHLDHAEPGDMPDPYSGKIMDGQEFGDKGEVIYGRGVNGQKASLAAMLMASKIILQSGYRLKRGFAVNAVVMEECGGHLGPKYFMEEKKLPLHWVLSGEHTDLLPITGHRGMINIRLSIEGKGSHAAAPQGSSSALTGVARVILALEKLKTQLPKDENLGDALVSLNRLFVSPNVANVIPDRCEAMVDARHPASLPREEIVRTIQSCIAETVNSQPGLKHVAEIKKSQVTTTTGVAELSDGCMFPFYTPDDHPLVMTLLKAIEEVRGLKSKPGLWNISSETGYFSTVAGLPAVAFGPGEDRFTHNADEHVRVEDIITTTKVYTAMIAKVCLESFSNERGGN